MGLMMRQFRVFLAISIGRFVYFLIKLFHLGEGSALPGWVAKRLFPDIFPYLIGKFDGDVVYITGTNGKTTTTHFLKTLIDEKDLIVNSTGANLETGLVTTLILEKGSLREKRIVFEVDERVLGLAIEKKAPTLLLILNLFRDQIDRYGEIDAIKNLWKERLIKLPFSTQLLFNGDDPLLVFLSKEIARPVHFFGLQDEGTQTWVHAVDSIHCPVCAAPLHYNKVYLAHLGDYACQTCDFKRGKPLFDSRNWEGLFPQIHNRYNALAALTAAHLMGKEVNRIKACSPPFGRGERVVKKGVEILLLLSKNPVSLNVSIETVKEIAAKNELGGVVIALNDGVADSRDLSWIWDSEIEGLISVTNEFYLTGARAHEGALLLRHFTQEECKTTVDLQIQSLLKRAIAATPKGKTLCILATYTAFLEIKRHALH